MKSGKKNDSLLTDLINIDSFRINASKICIWFDCLFKIFTVCVEDTKRAGQFVALLYFFVFYSTAVLLGGAVSTFWDEPRAKVAKLCLKKVQLLCISMGNVLILQQYLATIIKTIRKMC